MNFGVIGFGNIARKFVNSVTYTDGGRVSAVASRSATGTEGYFRAHPEVRLYRDYSALLSDSDIQAVYIALPHKLHLEWILTAMEHGKAVLCEKPMVLTSDQQLVVRRTVQKSGLSCIEAMKTKFNQAYQHLKEDVTNLGGVRKLECSFCTDRMESLPDKDSYHMEPVQGGALYDVGSYGLGFALGLTDAPLEDVRVKVRLIRGVDVFFRGELLFLNGASAIVEGAFDRQRERTAKIVCRDGTIEVPMFNRPVEYMVHMQDGAVIQRCFPFHGDDMTAEIQALIDTVQAGKTESKLHTLADSMQITQVMERIRQTWEREQ